MKMPRKFLLAILCAIPLVAAANCPSNAEVTASLTTYMEDGITAKAIYQKDGNLQVIYDVLPIIRIATPIGPAVFDKAYVIYFKDFIHSPPPTHRTLAGYISVYCEYNLPVRWELGNTSIIKFKIGSYRHFPFVHLKEPSKWSPGISDPGTIVNLGDLNGTQCRAQGEPDRCEFHFARDALTKLPLK